jgi:hypothetical protein
MIIRKRPKPMLTSVAALLAPGKMPSMQKLLRPVLFRAIGLAAIVGQHFSMGGVDLSPPQGWRMQVAGPHSVVFEHVSGPIIWTYYTKHFDGKIASVSVDIDIPDVESQKGQVRGAGLIFCNHMSNHTCDKFYVALLTTDNKLIMYRYQNGGWMSEATASFGLSNHKYTLTASPDPHDSDGLRLMVNTSQVAFGDYIIPQQIGILLAMGPG